MLLIISKNKWLQFEFIYRHKLETILCSFMKSAGNSFRARVCLYVFIMDVYVSVFVVYGNSFRLCFYGLSALLFIFQ